MTEESPALYVVPTPLGNLADITHRAVEVLRQVDWIAAEDTRHSAPLIAQCGGSASLVALHEHNEREQAQRIVARLLDGDDVALVSDAGTPLVSDPGYRLVRAARAAGVAVSPIPGACAAIAALSAAGLPSDRFVFEGFLPAKSAARRATLQTLRGETRTLIFYESSHRIVETLHDLVAEFGGEREAVVARELTKQFETVLDGTLAQLSERVGDDANQQRGEFVVLVKGTDGDDAAAVLAEGMRVYQILSAELPPSRAAKLAAEITGAPRNALYEQALALKAADDADSA